MLYLVSAKSLSETYVCQFSLSLTDRKTSFSAVTFLFITFSEHQDLSAPHSPLNWRWQPLKSFPFDMLLTAFQPELFLPDKRHSSSENVPVQCWAHRKVISAYLFAAFCVLQPWLKREHLSIGCSTWQALNWDQYLNKDAVSFLLHQWNKVLLAHYFSSGLPTSSLSVLLQSYCTSACSLFLPKKLFDTCSGIASASNPISANQHNPQKPLENATKNILKAIVCKRYNRKRNTQHTPQ